MHVLRPWQMRRGEMRSRPGIMKGAGGGEKEGSLSWHDERVVCFAAKGVSRWEEEISSPSSPASSSQSSAYPARAWRPPDCRLSCVWCMWDMLLFDRLVGLVVKASTSRAEDPGFESRLRWDFFSESSHTSDVIGSVLGLVGSVSVYCEWVRWKVWSATSISGWQQVKLSEQIRPWDILACCWDIKQPTNNNTTLLLSFLGGAVVWRPHRDAFFFLVPRGLLDVPATCLCISGAGLLRKIYVLPQWDRLCRSNFLPHPVIVYWHRANHSQGWPRNARRPAIQPLQSQFLSH